MHKEDEQEKDRKKFIPHDQCFPKRSWIDVPFKYTPERRKEGGLYQSQLIFNNGGVCVESITPGGGHEQNGSITDKIGKILKQVVFEKFLAEFLPMRIRDQDCPIRGFTHVERIKKLDRIVFGS